MRFGFLFNEVLTGLRRNVTMTVAMILTTAIALGLLLYLLNLGVSLLGAPAFAAGGRRAAAPA